MSWGVSKAICVQMSLPINKNQLGLPLKNKSKYTSSPTSECLNLAWVYDKCGSIGRRCSAFGWVPQNILVSQNSRPKFPSFLPADMKKPIWPLQSLGMDPLFRRIQKTSRAPPNDDPMLPDDVVPTSYKLQIRPILDPNDATGEQWTAPGKVEIDLACAKNTMQIVVKRDAKVVLDEDTIQVTETGGKGDVVPVTSKAYDAGTTFYTINVGRELVQGETYRLSMSFTAPIDATYKGLYRAEYSDENGQQYRLAMTQFQQKGARQMFPCFDEPRRKTPFTVSIGYKKEMFNVVGNSAVEILAQNDSTLEGWVWDHLKETVPMPTYLVAILVSNFAYEEAPSSIFQKPVRVYAEPRYIAKGWGVASANDAARLMTRHQKKYVHLYEMPKMDLIAIPSPFFPTGGMENWGAVIFAEDLLLFNEEEESWSNKYEITTLVSHELAHQWFGNLVTCQTWENLWLNEGFATYVASYGVEEIKPEFYERYARLETCHQALQFDLENLAIHSASAHPVIVYFKGAAIIRMMEGFLGETTLTAGLITYLKTLAYKTAVQDDLFEHLTTSAVQDGKLPPGKTVKDIMDTWTLQPGFPLIRVSKLGASQVQITQERFQSQIQSSGATNTRQDELFEVPLPITTPVSAIFSNYTPTIWLSKSETSTILSHDTSKWIFINPDRMGYYRVLYDKDLLQLILDQLKISRNAFSPISRCQLIQDYFEFYTNGYVSLEEALNVTSFLKNDKDTEYDFSVWNFLIGQLTPAFRAFQAFNSGPKHSLAEYFKPKIEDALRKIGSVPQPEDKGTLVVFKTILLNWACAFQSEICFTYAQETMTKWRNENKNPFFPDTRLLMYCTSVAMGGESVVDFLQIQFSQASFGPFFSNKLLLIRSLGCARDPPLLTRLLQDSTNKSLDIGQSEELSLNLYQGVAGNPIGRQVLWEFLDKNENVDRINTFFQNSYLQVYEALGDYVYTETELNKFTEVIQKNPNLGSSELQQLTTKVKQNIEWMKSNYAVYDAWFKSHSDGGESEDC